MTASPPIQRTDSRQRGLIDEVMALPMWDTHSHLKGGQLAASSFWHIGEYYWMFSELRGAGYPADAARRTPADRAARFVEAYRRMPNTMMHWCVSRIMRDLYDLEIESVADVHRADAMIEQTAHDPAWPAEVCRRLNIQHLTVNVVEDGAFTNLPDAACIVPRLETYLMGLADEIESAADPAAALDRAMHDVGEQLAQYRDAGYPAVMCSNRPWVHFSSVQVLEDAAEPPRGQSREAVVAALLHSVCAHAERLGLTVQLFLGIEQNNQTPGTPRFRADRITQLYPLFERYDARFELVLATSLNNADAVNAAWIFPHVHVGGMWWFNFRRSAYMQSMLQRFECLAPAKSSLVISDAHHIEWVYGKCLIVKCLLAEFIQQQVSEGWISHSEAVDVARQWLYETPRALYG